MVVMDNLSAHKVDVVRQLIEAAGPSCSTSALFAPFKPIEKAWAKLKQLLRAAKTRSKEALDQAISELLPQIAIGIGGRVALRLCSTLPSDPVSRRRPCASLSLLLHQDVKGTRTPKLSIMRGVPRECRGVVQAPLRHSTVIKKML